MTPELLKSNAPFKSNTQNKIMGDFSKRKCCFVCQFVSKRYFRVLKILDDIKQLNFGHNRSNTLGKSS